MRMVQPRNRARLALESLMQLVVCAEVGRQDLDRNRPVQPRIARAIDFAGRLTEGGP
jgi:hypothetical protein